MFFLTSPREPLPHLPRFWCQVCLPEDPSTLQEILRFWESDERPWVLALLSAQLPLCNQAHNSTLTNRTFLCCLYFLRVPFICSPPPPRASPVGSQISGFFCLASLFICWPFLSQKQCTGRTLLFHTCCFDPEYNWNCSKGHTLCPQNLSWLCQLSSLT